ncbi:MAG: chaperone modulator CbpM [Methylacidiphilales bacterium]|nr:chaperone modulator CbpM [Candidatus Methylacidiphilales bacterium]
MKPSKERDDTSGELYTIETVERITHISKDRIMVYQQYGIITAVSPAPPEELRFDEEAIHKLRRIALLLSEYGVNEKGVLALSSLIDEVERLREEIRFLRG